MRSLGFVNTLSALVVTSFLQVGLQPCAHAQLPSVPRALDGSVTYKSEALSVDRNGNTDKKQWTITLTNVHFDYSGTGASNAIAVYKATLGFWNISGTRTLTSATNGCTRTEQYQWAGIGSFGPSSFTGVHLYWDRANTTYSLAIGSDKLSVDYTMTRTCGTGQHTQGHSPSIAYDPARGSKITLKNKLLTFDFNNVTTDIPDGQIRTSGQLIGHE